MADLVASEVLCKNNPVPLCQEEGILKLHVLYYLTSVVPSWGNFACPSPTVRDTWRCLEIVQFTSSVCVRGWPLVSRSQIPCEASYNIQDSPPHKELDRCLVHLCFADTAFFYTWEVRSHHVLAPFLQQHLKNK